MDWFHSHLQPLNEEQLEAVARFAKRQSAPTKRQMIKTLKNFDRTCSQQGILSALHLESQKN
jgi:hypothetical protein